MGSASPRRSPHDAVRALALAARQLRQRARSGRGFRLPLRMAALAIASVLLLLLLRQPAAHGAALARGAPLRSAAVGGVAGGVAGGVEAAGAGDTVVAAEGALTALLERQVGVYVREELRVSNTVLVLSLGWRSSRFLRNFLRFAEDFGWRFAVLVPDAKTLRLVERLRPGAAALVPPGAVADPAPEDESLLKLLHAREVLRRGFNVVHMDVRVGVYPLQDPLSVMELGSESADAVMQAWPCSRAGCHLDVDVDSDSDSDLRPSSHLRLGGGARRRSRRQAHVATGVYYLRATKETVTLLGLAVEYGDVTLRGDAEALDAFFSADVSLLSPEERDFALDRMCWLRDAGQTACGKPLAFRLLPPVFAAGPAPCHPLVDVLWLPARADPEAEIDALKDCQLWKNAMSPPP